MISAVTRRNDWLIAVPKMTVDVHYKVLTSVTKRMADISYKENG